MGVHRASVVASPPPAPPAWIPAEADVSRPPLSAGADATFTQWDASRSPVTHDTLLSGCVATPIPGWVEDMRPLVEARTVSLMNASAERVVGVPVETQREEGHFYLRPVGAPDDAPRVGTGRTFVGWEGGDVLTCFALCATPKAAARSSSERACDASVMTARLEGSAEPPAPGIVLGAVTWGVHHPTTSVAWGGVLAFALGVVAVASRRRPRSRI